MRLLLISVGNRRILHFLIGFLLLTAAGPAQAGPQARIAVLGSGTQPILKDLDVPYQTITGQIGNKDFSLNNVDLLVVSLPPADEQSAPLARAMTAKGAVFRDFVRDGGMMLVMMMDPEGINSRIFPYTLYRAGANTKDVFVVDDGNPLFSGLRSNLMRTPCHATYGFGGLTGLAPSWTVLARGDNNKVYMAQTFWGKGMVLLNLVDCQSYYFRYFTSTVLTENLLRQAQEFLLANHRIAQPFLPVPGEGETDE